MSLLNKFSLVFVALLVWMLFRQRCTGLKPRANTELVQVEPYRSHHHLQVVNEWPRQTKMESVKLMAGKETESLSPLNNEGIL